MYTEEELINIIESFIKSINSEELNEMKMRNEYGREKDVAIKNEIIKHLIK